VALYAVVTNRTRISAAICLALTLGTVINVFGLQGVRRPPLAAVAEAVPVRSPMTVATKPTALVEDRSLQPMSNADSDLSLRSSGSSRTAAEMPAPEAAPADAKLVAAIQRELAGHGYDPGKINGIVGIVTRSAIMAFEFDQHFSMTGEPSEELMRRLVLGLSGPAGEPSLPPSEKAKRVVGGAQRLLQRLGYDPGPINGQLDDPTRKALRRFEGDTGMVPRGRVSGEVIAELARRAHARIEVSDEALSR